MQFEVKEYGKDILKYLLGSLVFFMLIDMHTSLIFLVLPKFSVKVSVPPYILKTDDAFGINITAR